MRWAARRRPRAARRRAPRTASSGSTCTAAGSRPRRPGSRRGRGSSRGLWNDGIRSALGGRPWPWPQRGAPGLWVSERRSAKARRRVAPGGLGALFWGNPSLGPSLIRWRAWRASALTAERLGPTEVGEEPEKHTPYGGGFGLTRRGRVWQEVGRTRGTERAACV